MNMKIKDNKRHKKGDIEMDNMDKSWKAVGRMTIFLGGMLISGVAVSFFASVQLKSLAIGCIVLWLIFFVLWLVSVIQWTILHKQDIKRIGK